MQLHSLLVLAAAEWAAAEQLLPMQAVGGVSARQLFAKSEPVFDFSKRATCDVGQVACHDGCIPIGGQCCASSGWCKVGTVCDDKLGGCCPLGKTCTSGPTGGLTCDTGYTPCKDKCMPVGGDCCSNGNFCKAGTKCDGNGGCTTGGGGGGGGGSNQCLSTEVSCNDNCMPKGSVCCGNGRYCQSGYTCVNGGLSCSPGGTGGDGGGGGGGGGGGNQCLATQEACNNKCMPKGSVCCGNGKYCRAGYTCVNAGLNCSPGGTGGGTGGGSSAGGDSGTTSAAPGTTALPTYTLTSDDGSGASPTNAQPTDTQSGPTPLGGTTAAANPLPTNSGAGTAVGTNAPTQTRAPAAAGVVQVPLAWGAVAMALPLVL
ncbi:hypothetical protein H634G_02666 [Metarhizium anisopliae BRIP 53293]|uniref:Granulins domain-containing protein n=1 Tax=Metarhizium anisopliae BRIP 53293 TaxID=1291518 RepID=A0A0D9P5I1_METAN|nr:hypothetical protein H634G_02666 [Metarhizium anisopliae BRIP 53293]KJK89019.1 hypothetical protein H633G_07127 [Metarhizium anisopliae BRIP 53284]